MELSKLEIKGFKSFGDKITVNFDKGITGIVGPNGCGKSNIVDAIRWVLGEQKTRALRSEKMENIIFNGTKKRKPLQMAEVSLTFNNTRNILPTEYSQVTITRRYYRSGDGEYLLNGVTCRLKDINNLFLDTGIGPDSYAIIELKMVDDLLNDRENSRRNLFEEAAGISKFKKRKKESLKKLQDTDKDLERVEDLLFEINKNMKSLEKQAKQAKKYYNLKEEYKVKSVDYAKVTLKSQKETLNSIQKQLDEQQDKKTSLNTRIQEKESIIEKVKSDIINKEKLLKSRQKSLNEHVQKIRQYENEKQIKNERLNFLRDKVESLREQIDADRKSNERASFSLDSLNREKQDAEKELQQVQQRAEGLKEVYEAKKEETAALQEQSGEANRKFRSTQEEVHNLNKELEIKKIQLNSLRQELEKNTSETTESNEKISEFKEKLESLQTQINKKKEELTKLQEEEEKLNKDIGECGKEIDHLKESITQINRKLDARENEFSLTKSMVENLEGYPEAVKFLKKNTKWGKDIPLLSDVLTCDEDYRVAIENYLEPLMSYYVVPTEVQAIEAVHMLSDASKGKANFFILSKFDNFTPTPVREHPNAVPAISIVDFDEKYQKLVQYVLDNLYVITEEQDKLPVQDDAIFITQNGKITKRQFSISGGSVGLFEGKRIGRVKNLQKLEKEIKKLSGQIDKERQILENKQKHLHSLQEATRKEDIEVLRSEVEELSRDEVGLKTQHDQYETFLTQSADKKEDIQDRISALQEEIASSEPEAVRKQNELSGLEENMNALNEQLSMQNEQLQESSSAFNQENVLFHQKQNRVSQINQELEFKRSTYENSKERIEKNQEELKKLNEEINRHIAKAETNDEELIGFYKEKEDIEAGVNEAEKEYYAVRGEIDETEKIIREIRNSRETTDAVILELQNKLNETKISLSSVKERLKVEFEVDLDEILEEEGELPDAGEDELKEEVEKIRSKMDKAGPINPMAMEAYEEIQERHTFITGQKEDLTKAKNSLLDTIKEIDTVAKETFIATFDEIKENFLKVFRTLFTEEDTCDLKLSDPDSPLESTIEIMAKPKGKRPLSINQLSGGEKTLTATSLLFAIYLIKPAPFCIFDEVDAPLDDANIDKFNNIIRTFSKESQFIIVTHNKRTMSSTDVIYGVTMLEQGVSRLVPVDLRSLA